MTTANEITDGAYRLCGVQTPDSTEDAFALTALNEMIALWSMRGLVVPFLTKETFSMVAGTDNYTIGSGGTVDTVRPIVIESCKIRDSGSLDTPIDTRMTLDEYNAIHNKATQDIPRRMYYDPQYSLGIMYFDPNPNAAYTCQIHSRKPLTSFSLISSTMDLPPEYAKALRFSLALDLAPEINVTLDKLTINKAHGAQNEIEELNSSAVRWVDFDDAITRPLRR